MNKKEEEETPEEKKPEVKEEAIDLVEVPTQMGLAYKTPEGNMSEAKYLVWLGRLILEIKESLSG